MANLRLFLTSHILKLLAACFSDQRSLRPCNGEAAACGVFAGGCAGVALREEEAVAGLVGEGGKHEEVAGDVGSTLLLALKLRWEVKESSNDVGDWVERAEESIVEEVTLGGSLQPPCQADDAQQEKVVDQHDLAQLPGHLAQRALISRLGSLSHVPHTSRSVRINVYQ